MRTGIVRVVTFSLFQIGRVFAQAARVLNHAAAGTLTIDGLRGGVERTWADFSACDAEIAAGLTPGEAEVIARFVSRQDDLLLVGSGSGRDLIALAASGYRVTGVDPARQAVAVCRRQLERRALTAEIIEGFFEDVALPRRFDVILFAGFCYSFIPESRRRIAALRKAANHLAPRGRIIVTCTTDAPDHPVLIQLTRLSAALSRSDWHPEHGDVILTVDPVRPLFHYEHRFGAGELEAEAQAAGLRTVHHGDVLHMPIVVLEATDDAPPAPPQPPDN